MIRATTIGVLKNYRYGLNNSFTKLNDARTTVLSHRNFNSFAEDPSAAALSFQLRHSRMTVESQYTVCDTTYRKFQSAWATLETVLNDVDNATSDDSTLKKDALEALNDPTGDARAALSKDIHELADTLVQLMNNKYGDDFIFSGADGQTVPFTWGENGELLYRGIDVNAAEPELVKDAGQPIECDDKGVVKPNGGYYLNAKNTSLMTAADFDNLYPEPKPINVDGQNVPEEVNKDGSPYIPANADPDNPNTTGGYYAYTDGSGVIPINDYNSMVAKYESAPTRLMEDNAPNDSTPKTVTDEKGNQCYVILNGKPETISPEKYEKAKSDAEKLRYLSQDEKIFQDIGLGNEEDKNDKTIVSSVFDATLQGINFLGYGIDADGDPKNIVSIVRKMADICDNEGGKLSQQEYDELFRLTGKMERAADTLKKEHVAMDARSSKLKNNLGLLEQNKDTLTEQYSEIEDVDDADAISAFIWAQYSYNAALRVGNSILAQSLMDYMQ